jgi:regulator of cell morphogenesis and NO signaling
MMYLTNRTYTKPDMKISVIVKENPSILLVLQNFGIDDKFDEKTVSDLCKNHGIGEYIFSVICNLYNGFNFIDPVMVKNSDIPAIISYLKNSHYYYKNEKYPEITDYIKNLSTSQQQKEIKLIETFFNEYFSEVNEHLDYEEKIAFPYFYAIYENRHNLPSEKFSAADYLDHHSDIESKLSDLKNLILDHLQIKNKGSVKRKLLLSLFELEFDLKIHSMIEELILIPLVIALEDKIK